MFKRYIENINLYVRDIASLDLFTKNKENDEIHYAKQTQSQWKKEKIKVCSEAFGFSCTYKYFVYNVSINFI